MYVHAEKKVTDDLIEELVYDFSNLFVAGTDTSSNSTTMLLYFCSKYPEVMKKVQ